MFAVRGLAVSLSSFFLLYALLSVLVMLSWRGVLNFFPSFSARRNADLLLLLRVLPFGVSLAVTLLFGIPSFLVLEPRNAEEALGIAPLILSLACVLLLMASVWKAASALLRTSRAIARWSRQAIALDCTGADGPASIIPVQRTSAPAPPLTAAGILRPGVWLSAAAEFVLTERELATALRHEFVHIQRRDNLRKLVMRSLSFPGMRPLESAWREATEMAADDAAVASASEALDLAAAVIKLSRLGCEASPVLTAALVQSPASSLNARVSRLIEWSNSRRESSDYSSKAPALTALAAFAFLVMISYSHLLMGAHIATEWLVR
jgi:beta-lactamase regulating signal transducer with metallopeptidase domain